MVSDREFEQIYAREINEPLTLSAFLHSRVYFCDYEKSGRLGKMFYFAPHFGQAIAAQHPGIKPGISYVATIEDVEIVDSWQDVEKAVKKNYGRKWTSHMDRLRVLRKKWSWNNQERRSLLFVGEPRHVFNPPIQKDNLQKGSGWLSKRFFSFDDLFKAWKV